MEKRNKIVLYLLSALLPMVLLSMVLAAAGITPFGNNSLVMVDMSNQYIDYFAYFKTLFSGGGNTLFYTFAKNLGGDMFGLAAYYLFSPFNLLLLLFSNQMLPMGVTLVFLLKIGACGLSFCYYLGRSARLRWTTLLFSTSYACIAYTVAYCFNVMWLDGVLLLPLLVLGLDRLFAGGKARLYVASLALALATNYYIGYMLCIFSLLYFLYKLAAEKSEKGTRMKKAGRFLLSSLLAGGLSAVVLVPTFLSLQGEKFTFSLSRMAPYGNYPFFAAFAKLYTNTTTWEQEVDGGLPQLFCGIFIVLLCIQYFFNKKIEKRQKWAMGGLLAALFLSFWLNTLNLLWHGFSHPIWFPYRYSFVVSFLLVVMAHRDFETLSEGLNGKRMAFSAALFLLGTLLTAYFDADAPYISAQSLLCDALLGLGYAALLYAYYGRKNVRQPLVAVFTRRKQAALVALVLAVAQFGNLAVNAYSTIQMLLEQNYEEADAFSGYVTETEAVIDWVQAQDSSFYRLEKTFYRSNNDAMQFDYSGISHYSSCQQAFVKLFLSKLGFKNNWYYAYYRIGSTAAVDSLLGVKYLLSKYEPDKPYAPLYEENGITVYENPYALPLGFAVSEDVLGVSIYAQENLFELQNAIFSGMTGGKGGTLFHAAQIEVVTTSNVSVAEEGGYTTYTKLKDGEGAYVEYAIAVDSAYPLYGYLDAPTAQSADIFVDGLYRGEYFSFFRWDIFPLGAYAPGDTATLRIVLMGDSLTLTDACFYYEDTQALADCYAALSGGFCTMEEKSSSYLEGTVTVEEDGQYLLFSIPCEEGWTVKIDGQAVEPEAVFHTLLGVRISAGTHTIKLTYVPKGFYFGLFITVLTAVLGICLFILSICKRREDVPVRDKKSEKTI